MYIVGRPAFGYVGLFAYHIMRAFAGMYTASKRHKKTTKNAQNTRIFFLEIYIY